MPSAGDARHLLADGAQSQDAQRLARQRLRHGVHPLRLLLMVGHRAVRFGDMEQRADDVLRHRFGVRAARAGEGESGRQVGQRQPALDARAHRLRPAQLGHAGQQAGRHGTRHQRLGARELLGRRPLLARQGVDGDAIGKTGRLDGIEVGGGLVGPQQDMRAIGHDGGSGRSG
jgi:hypothetical protein